MSKKSRKNPQANSANAGSGLIPAKPAWRGWLLPTGMLLLLLVSVLWWVQPGLFMPVSSQQSSPPVALASPQVLAMVDEQTCQACHAEPVKQWQGSHHQRAMELPTEQTVLGDFNDVTFKSDKETTRETSASPRGGACSRSRDQEKSSASTGSRMRIICSVRRWISSLRSA